MKKYARNSPSSVSPAKVVMMETLDKNGFDIMHGLPTLCKSVEVGDVNNMELILKKSKDELNRPDVSGFTPLQHAAKHGHVQALELLLKQESINIDVLGKQGLAALHLAVKHRRKECVQMLLSHGAKLNVYDSYGKTATHIAARKASKEILQILLKEKDADVDVESREGYTPLHAAVVSGSVEICQLLIKSGADVYKADIGNQTPLIFAAMDKYPEVLQLIISAARKTSHRFDGYLHHKDHEGSNALHLAVVNNHYENVKLLLEAGAQVNYPRDDHATALHMVAVFGFDPIATLLIDHGGDLNVKTHNEHTPLHRAAIYNSKSCAEIFIANGALVDSPGPEGKTPLHYAVQKASLDTIRLLLQEGAKPKLTDDCGRTILHFVVHNDDLTCLELLMELLPKGLLCELLESVDVDERTPLHYCAEAGKLELLNKLLELGAVASSKDEQEKTPIHLAAENGHALCVEALFNHSRSEINDDDVDGRTPMLLACLSGHYGCVKVLLRFGGDVAARGRDEANHSALTLAAAKGHLELVDLLLDNGGMIDIATKMRETALHLACAGDHVSVVKLLISRNASVVARTINGQTPLDMAIEHRSQASAAAIISSDKWEDAMSCLDKQGHNPLPMLVAFMPSVASLVMDNCIKPEGDVEDEEYQVTYNFKYIDPHPDSIVCQRGPKIWYCNDIAEHNCDQLINHELTYHSMEFKWKTFVQTSFMLDFLYYVVVVITLSAFIILIPHITSDYYDIQGCPMILSEEEAANETLREFYYQNGTYDRYNISTPGLLSMVQSFQITAGVLFFSSVLRLVFSIITLRLQFFQQGNTYSTIIMIGCVTLAIGLINLETLVMCSTGWRFAWIGIMVSWGNLITYIIRFPVVGIYVTMFQKVLVSVVKTLAVLIVFFVCYAFCFFIILHDRQEFSEPLIVMSTVLDMALGELNYVDRFVTGNTGPLRIDGLVLITLFMVCVPIALMNLLIGVAVGDIEAIKNQAEIRLLTNQIKTIDEYGRYNLKYFQRRWHTDSTVVYPNRRSKNIIAMCVHSCRRISKRSVFERSKGWIYQSQISPVIDTMEVLNEKLERTQARLNTMRNDMERQNEWLLAIANKVGAKLDERGKYTDHS